NVTALPDDPATRDGDLLSCGELHIIGRISTASNVTLVAEAALGDRRRRCVYKPVRGERPLWDFPDGTLAGREVAAYLVSAATGWGLVPPTVLRDGACGVGARQIWVDEPEDATALVGVVAADDLPPGWLPIAD